MKKIPQLVKSPFLYLLLSAAVFGTLFQASNRSNVGSNFFASAWLGVKDGNLLSVIVLITFALLLAVTIYRIVSWLRKVVNDKDAANDHINP